MIVKTVLAIEEIGLIEMAINIVQDAIDRGDLSDLVSEENLEKVMEYYYQGYFDSVLKFCEEVE